MDTITLLIINFVIFLGIYLIVKIKPEWFLGEDHRRLERERKVKRDQSLANEQELARANERVWTRVNEKQAPKPTLLNDAPVMSTQPKMPSIDSTERKFM